MKKASLIAGLISFFGLGCGLLSPMRPEPYQSLLRGYVTQCRSTILVSVDQGKFSSSLLVPAGTQRVIIEARSEPEDPDEYFDSAYLCQEVSQHELQFQSLGGKTYRLHLEEHDPQKYSISVWEGYDSRAIETKPVEAHSIQQKIHRQCRYYYECNPMYGE